MTEHEIHIKKASISRDMNYFSKLMSGEEKWFKHTNTRQTELIKLYHSFSNDEERMKWLDEQHKQLISL